MKIKTLNGEKEVEAIVTAFQKEVWVAWADIKPILDEYIAAIENDQVGCSDYGLMIDKNTEM